VKNGVFETVQTRKTLVDLISFWNEELQVQVSEERMLMRKVFICDKISAVES